jgi:rfaE bifunctional protein nucleotidyltransferase chain/domain
VKTRLRRGDQVVARLDQGGSGVEIAAAPAAALDAIAAADAVLVSDYGRGVTSAPNLADALTGAAGSRPVAWDPHPRGGPPVPGARVVTPNAAEAAHFCGAPRAVSLAEACRQARDLVTAWAAGGVALTLGGRGAVLASGADTAAVFPVPNSVSADACGAGDRFAGAVACALASGALTSEAVACGVHAATTFLAGGGVAALGAAPASRSGGLVRELVTSVHARRGTVVATGGCFDLLHAGHVATLNAARALGDCLIVCINSDASVRRRKGPDRPLQSVADRRRVLEGLRAVDAVLVFDEDTPRQVLPMIRPDIWVKGGDYAGAELPETGLVRSWGGEVVTVPYLPGHSTSQLLTRVRA